MRSSENFLTRISLSFLLLWFACTKTLSHCWGHTHCSTQAAWESALDLWENCPEQSAPSPHRRTSGWAEATWLAHPRMRIQKRGLCQQHYLNHMTWPLSPSCPCVSGHGQRPRQGIARGWKMLQLNSTCQRGKTSRLFHCLPSLPRRDLLLPPEWFRMCQELETQETRSAARSPLSLFHGNERQVALITLETNHLLLKANLTLAVTASPPPRSPTPSALAWVSG